MWISALADFLTKNKIPMGVGAVLVLTGVGYAACFPPFNVPEAAFVFLVPLFVGLRSRPSYRTVAWVSFLSSFVAWVVLIFWLRHVTLFGVFGLSAFVAFHFMLFALGSNWLARRFLGRDSWLGVAFALGVAAWWVLLEYLRTWLLTGFPWLPLSTSQWDRPIMLQGAEFLGAWGVSFILVLLNAGLASYAVRIYEYASTKKKAFCPEFYLALVVFVCLTFLQMRRVSGQERVPLFRAAVLQPAVPQDQKWDEDFALGILDRLKRNTLLLGPMSPDVVFWPEATTPYSVNGDKNVKSWMEALVNELNVPVVAGSIGLERGEEAQEERWYNSVFLIRPEWGAYPRYYSKRHLVPFGEYIPLRHLWPWMTKFVPLEGDILPGDSTSLISLSLSDSTVLIGPLICYEDIFPELARESVKDGAGMLFVASNSAWYGQSAAADQHKAHSVLRAVETRRIVLRVGNDGWTGWIDEFGNIRDRFEQYVLGGTAWNLDRDRRWFGRQTFYVKHGDWFVAACLGMVAILGLWGWSRGDRLADRM